MAGGGVAVLLLVGPASAGNPASPKPDDRGTHGVGAVAIEQPSAAVRPDDRGTQRGAGAIDGPVLTLRSKGGFDWSDASIGAFGGAGIVLLLTAAVAFVASRRTGTDVALR